MNRTELQRLQKLFVLIGIALAGLACSSLFAGVDLVHSVAYITIAGALLFVGLYMAVFGIDQEEAKKEWRVVLAAVTFGVLCKYLLIFGATYAVTRRWEYAILAMAITQIDPLSIAAISDDNERMSKRSKTVLGAWASFDDPVTAVMTPLIMSLTALIAHQDLASDSTTHWMAGGIALAIAVTAFALARRYRSRAQKTLQFVVLSATAVSVVATKVFAWAALLGWFVQPQWLKRGKRADRITYTALIGATFLLGILLADGIDWRGGLVLGVAAFAAQMVATVWVLKVASRIGPKVSMHEPFSKRDKWHIALAQQNGITAIVLALNLEPFVPNSIAIVASAIVVINLINFVANGIYDRVAKH